MKSADYQYAPKEGFVLTHFLTVADVKRSADFYLRILGGKVIRSGEPTIIQIANSWLVLNLGGGPTDDKPTISLHTPQNSNEYSTSLTFVSQTSRPLMRIGERRELSFLPSQRIMLWRSAATCVILMGI